MPKIRKIVLMSIKPKFANKILFGVKKFEYRKKPIHPDTTHIVLYMTAPIMKIVGIATIKDVHVGSPSAIWEKTKQSGGVVRSFYREYFRGKKEAYAIELDEAFPFNHWVDPRQVDRDFKSPQSFKYISENFFAALLANKDKDKELNRIMFFGGIHGVGKSTFCNRLKEDIAIQTYSASELIKKEKGAISDSNKRVQNVDDNQLLLLNALKKQSQKGDFILDGHFCLINAKDEIETIPIKVFKKINPHELLLLELEAEKVYENLKKRDGKSYDVGLIQRMLEIEREHAFRVSKTLQIPLEVIKASDYNRIKKQISMSIKTYRG